jgi:TonB family protein
MPHTTRLSVASALFGLSMVATVVAQRVLPKPESWLLQSAHLAGDQVEGFTKTCVIVYSDGEYHRERRQQVSSGGHAQFDWKEPEVSEAKLSQGDLNGLLAILDNPELSTINGAIGDSGTLSSKLAFNMQGAVVPSESVEILTVAVARPHVPQIFEVADVGVAKRQEQLRALLDWLKGRERGPAQHLAASQANNCSFNNASIGKARVATGATPPKPVQTRNPQAPHGSPKPQAVIVKLLINPDGSVAEASLQDHSSPDIEQRALGAVRKWQFEPARLLGVPIAKTIEVRIEFHEK